MEMNPTYAPDAPTQCNLVGDETKRNMQTKIPLRWQRHCCGGLPLTLPH